MQKHLSELVLLLCLGGRTVYVATVMRQSESNNTNVYFWHHVCEDARQRRLTDCRSFRPPSGPSKWLLDALKPNNFSREMRITNWERLSLSLSAASFLMTRINSHYLPAEEKVTWKTKGGMSVSTTPEPPFPPVLSHPHPFSPALFPSDWGRQDSPKQMFWSKSWVFLC